MKSLHQILHGRLWIRVHEMPKFASSAPQEVGPIQIPEDHGNEITINDCHVYFNIFYNNNCYGTI